MKYYRKKTNYNGITYDSQSEAFFASILDGLLKDGKIKKIERQVKLPLENMQGQLRMRYVPDFKVTLNDGREKYLEVKGVLTAANKVKMAYARYVHKVDFVLIPTAGPKAFHLDWLS